MDQTSFLSGPNAPFIEELYAKYLENAASVDPSWRSFFDDLKDDATTVLQDIRGASWSPRERAVEIGNGHEEEVSIDDVGRPRATVRDLKKAALDSLRAMMLIRAYRVRGHLEANLDPLELKPRGKHAELDPRTYGFTEADMDREIVIDNAFGYESATLRQIVHAVRQTYCGSIGIEYMHIENPEQKKWLQMRIEGSRAQRDFTGRGRRTILERLTAAEMFERFLDKKFTGTKRFGLDGGETAIAALEQIIKRGSQLGLKEVVIGMAHRGRLNVLANFMNKPFSAIFSEFQGNSANPEDVQGSADVKYHLGTSADREFDGHVVHLSLNANPSHLEAVNTVVLGKVRAKQRQRGDKNREQVMGLLIHGDAAFAGQGLVPESLDLSELLGYRTGGTIHFIINNQIGFTTSPVASRSGPYCSDIAKGVQAPILHVNADDPEAVLFCAGLAMEFRQEFKRDVVIDMFCYRRYGHNESDEPAFTQPLMYRKIANHPTTRTIYAEKLVQEGVLTQAEVDKIMQDFQHHLETEFEGSANYKPNKADWLEGAWAGLAIASGDERRGETSITPEGLQEVGKALTTVPATFNVNRKIARQLAQKEDMFKTGEGIDWATGEALAFGTLLNEGVYVRLSGQDCKRGTFSQRHAVLIDQENETEYTPLNNIREGQAHFEVIDSPLSEAGVLGFEYGFSLAEPRALVLWEAQFGDFANGAQVIIDQFISSGEAKWLRMSGLVMLLPHGYEGQGPEHSSARLERYLQACAEDNLQVVNATTPANYFHVLRRQVHRNFRKPLIMMTPKSLLRHKLCVSKLPEFGPGTSFHRLLWDDAPLQDKDIKRLVLCSGKVYYDLFEEREKRGIKDIYLLRVEQLYPFPAKSLAAELKRFPKAEIVWCQEEPKNMGAWTFVMPEIEAVMETNGHRQPRLIYAGRPAAAAPATGLFRRHVKEQATLIDQALGQTSRG
ncbi:2-oxoglutarate dehydrogenase E1 component [Dongia soli]|uniref:2-oxoglutarate dehydrogenase E1 component n=1 Tax=Dongia soli TaxID=600628 RepID=A0ABU5E689_9PROT|nr:2-oxoglutarate dehydrogenase E1 component [Dongia soli]MDY0881723.1 2-oxoglutarate dehydrogenase E1 component [Dongia soli]